MLYRRSAYHDDIFIWAQHVVSAEPIKTSKIPVVSVTLKELNDIVHLNSIMPCNL